MSLVVYCFGASCAPRSLRRRALHRSCADVEMANFTDVWDELPPCRVVVPRLCPCLAFLFKPQHKDREVETVSLMGSAQSLADPEPDHVPSAAAQLWFQKMQASVYRSEPRRRALAAGRSHPARPNPQPTAQAQKSPKPRMQEQAQAQAQRSPEPHTQEREGSGRKSLLPRKSPGRLRVSPSLMRAGSSTIDSGETSSP